MIANRSALNPFVDHKHHVPYAKFDLYESYGMSNEIPSYVSHAITSLNSSKRHMPIKILLMEALAKGTMSKKRILKKNIYIFRFEAFLGKGTNFCFALVMLF